MCYFDNQKKKIKSTCFDSLSSYLSDTLLHICHVKQKKNVPRRPPHVLPVFLPYLVLRVEVRYVLSYAVANSHVWLLKLTLNELQKHESPSVTEATFQVLSSHVGWQLLHA